MPAFVTRHLAHMPAFAVAHADMGRPYLRNKCLCSGTYSVSLVSVVQIFNRSFIVHLYVSETDSRLDTRMKDTSFVVYVYASACNGNVPNTPNAHTINSARLSVALHACLPVPFIE